MRWQFGEDRRERVDCVKKERQDRRNGGVSARGGGREGGGVEMLRGDEKGEE